MFSIHHIDADMALGLKTAKITSNSCHCGIALTSLKLPKKCFALGIIRDNQIILSSAEPIIWCEDDILAVALSAASVPELKFALNKRHPVHYSSQECPIKNLNTSDREPFNSCYKDGYKLL
ncbi:hypothetical protein [Nodularia chucula]|uniref:hypothetical protein n=1 Tax=Nodularia chucula TaxID=3093667 RepID=UPI0039C63B38